jgi:hypothetical protein
MHFEVLSLDVFHNCDEALIGRYKTKRTAVSKARRVINSSLQSRRQAGNTEASFCRCGAESPTIRSLCQNSFDEGAIIERCQSHGMWRPCNAQD